MVNTAILTGRRVAVPIKLVTVETDGQVREVDDPVTCSSTDVDVVKVQRESDCGKQLCCFTGCSFHNNTVNYWALVLNGRHCHCQSEMTPSYKNLDLVSSEELCDIGKNIETHGEKIFISRHPN